MLTTDLTFLGVALRFSNCCITTSYCIEPRDRHSGDPFEPYTFVNTLLVGVVPIKPGKMWLMQQAPKELGDQLGFFLEQAKRR
jgi:hypothetical protein